MWLVTNRGFFSGVQDKADPNVIVIRARTDRHLKALMDLLPEGTKIITSEGTDYPCRVRVSAAEWIALCAKLAAEVDYTNFKDSVELRPGVNKKHARHDHHVYVSVWSVLHRLTSVREERAQSKRRHARRRAKGRDTGAMMAARNTPPIEPLFERAGDEGFPWDVS